MFDAATLVQQFLEYVEATKSPKTRYWYAQKLRFFTQRFGAIPIDAIKNSQLQAWVISVGKQGWSLHTQHCYLRAARAFLRWLYLDDVIQTELWKRIKLPTLGEMSPVALAEQDFQLLKLACENVRDRAIVCFLWDTGCRVGGLVSLTLQALYLDHCQAVVTEKGNKSRTVFYTTETKHMLEQMLTERSPQNTLPFVFCSLETPKLKAKGVPASPLTTSGVSQLLRRLATRAKVDTYNPHAFRHAFAVRATVAGMPLGTLSTLMGHSGTAVTHRYYCRLPSHELENMYKKYLNNSKNETK